MQKELGRYLLPVFRKKYNTVRHLKKYPPKVKNYDLNVTEVLISDFKKAFSRNFQFHGRHPTTSIGTRDLVRVPRMRRST